MKTNVQTETLAEEIKRLDDAITGHGARIDQAEAANRDRLRPVSNINFEGLTDDRT